MNAAKVLVAALVLQVDLRSRALVSSLVTNQALGPGKDGGFSGLMDLQRGDVIDFECQILNDTSSAFLGANDADDDEMCILIGDTVGAQIPIGCTPSDFPVTGGAAR